MILSQLTENEQRVTQVVTDDVNTTGTSKQGQIKTPGHILTELFGEPQHPNDGDINFIWELELHTADDQVVVTIYDWRHNSGIDLSEIEVWNVGAKRGADVWLLEDYIANKTGAQQ